ncbi:MAG: hypothetical protein NXH83_16220 [Rhodobacteraceae bacterium]|nr:hypothetical protein [Paracoccaceae bacterium]
MTTILMLGSGPGVTEVADWPRAPFDRIVAINNAWRVRPDWDDLIHPWDFPEDRMPPAPVPGQRIVTEADFVPAQNRWGGFVYAGATMAYTAGYWALDALAPRVLAYFGCDMHYPTTGQTHFYGAGTADPLRPDITLQSLEAKAARLMILAAEAGHAVVNLSDGPSRLVFPRARAADLDSIRPAAFDRGAADEARAAEAGLGYHVPSGRYWEELDRFDPAELSRIDALWLAAAGHRAA